MKSFSELNIETASKGFEGDKIKMSKILDREIVVYHFKIVDSKVFKERGSGKCMHLQISINDEKHIVFTGASGLIDAIIQVSEDDFPFTTTITKENERFKFT